MNFSPRNIYIFPTDFISVLFLDATVLQQPEVSPGEHRVTNIYQPHFFTTTFSNHAETEIPEVPNENKKGNTKMSYAYSEVIN